MPTDQTQLDVTVDVGEVVTGEEKACIVRECSYIFSDILLNQSFTGYTTMTDITCVPAAFLPCLSFLQCPIDDHSGPPPI